MSIINNNNHIFCISNQSIKLKNYKFYVNSLISRVIMVTLKNDFNIKYYTFYILHNIFIHFNIFGIFNDKQNYNKIR
jgi:hypothetical protein